LHAHPAALGGQWLRSSTAFEVGLLFRKVHDSVWNATHEQQEPFTYGVLPAEAFYFKTAGN